MTFFGRGFDSPRLHFFSGCAGRYSRLSPLGVPQADAFGLKSLRLASARSEKNPVHRSFEYNLSIGSIPSLQRTGRATSRRGRFGEIVGGD